MDFHEKPIKFNIKVEKIVGAILLIPPILGVLFFVLGLFSTDLGNVIELRNLSRHWSGNYSYEGGGYTSAIPIYLGLMAIAGALLLKGTDGK